jgi:hypothetical protein
MVLTLSCLDRSPFRSERRRRDRRTTDAAGAQRIPVYESRVRETAKGHRPRGLRSWFADADPGATGIAIVVAVLLAGAIFFGSSRLKHFDAALVGYAVATIFLAFGVTYRYVVWVKSPPARRYLIQGWKAFLSVRNFLRFPTLVPRQLASNLAFQTFIRERGLARWAAHQAIFWGVVGATLITFPLTFGWIHFRAEDGGSAYAMFLFGVKAFTFDPLSALGWLAFHGLDVTAVLVIGGCAYYLWRRFRDRGSMTDQHFAMDLLPLVALIAISVTGLLLTLSAAVLEGRYYDFLAILHMGVVVLTLVFIPFGKFFHVIQRPASVGVQVYKATSVQDRGVFACQRCGEPLEGVAYVEDLERTVGELGLGYEGWVETCPRCKRIERGQAYRQAVKGGFR